MPNRRTKPTAPPFPPEMVRVYRDAVRGPGKPEPSDEEAERTAREWWELLHAFRYEAMHGGMVGPRMPEPHGGTPFTASRSMPPEG